MKIKILILLIFINTLLNLENCKSNTLQNTNFSDSTFEVDRGFYEDENFKIYIKSEYDKILDYSMDSSYYFINNSIIVLNKKNNKVCKSIINNPDYHDITYDIMSYSKSLNISLPFIEVKHRGSSDVTYHEFFNIANDTILKLFKLVQIVPNSLKKLNKDTLICLEINRDELVQNFYESEVLITLDSFKLIRPKIELIDIYYNSIALETFNTFKNIKLNNNSKYKVKRHKKILILDWDLINDIIRIEIKNKIYYCRYNDIKGKVQENAAG